MAHSLHPCSERLLVAPRFCGERACSRWSAQRSRFYWDRYAAQREQARSPQKRGATKSRSLQGCSECAKLVHEQT
ncbi:hypothetical protein FEM54_24700 [Pseudomonas edaphica]|uniref:Uncharacterized protein n=1 Tax=Pseudomonas edaphica TaxID=2006980 RepID=A0ABY2TYT4_9PSED|nr:hypothetical protein FEM54_24700 [Pseudomonas edaphica]